MELIFSDVKARVDEAINKHGHQLAEILLSHNEFSRFRIAVGNHKPLIDGEMVYRNILIIRRRR